MDKLTAALLTLFVLLGPCPLALAQQQADAVLGIWIDADKEGYIQIYRENGAYHGQIVGGTEGAPRLDKENPDPDKRERSLLGARIMQGFEFNGRDRWEDGSVYDPNNGKTYSGWMALENSDTLKLRGFIGISLLGRTTEWTRVNKQAPGVDTSVLK